MYQAEEAIKVLKNEYSNEKYNAFLAEADSIYANMAHIETDDLISRLRALGNEIKQFLDANDTSYVVNITKQTAEKKNGDGGTGNTDFGHKGRRNCSKARHRSSRTVQGQKVPVWKG
jgi:hypothetical protein